MSNTRDSKGRFKGKQKIVTKCDYCGKELFRHPCRLKHKHQFCDQKCLGKYNKIHGNFTKGHKINNGKMAWNNRLKISKKEFLKHYSKDWQVGINNNNWNNGSSSELYSVDWTETLKQSIRERDHYRCQICGKSQGDIAHAIHHIDYDKRNCNPINLITLCHSCHSKTNFKHKHWIKYFKNKE